MDAMPHRLTRRTAMGALALLGLSGCVNSITMISKTLLGDPTTKSRFKTTTGVDLVKDEKTIILQVTAPTLVAGEYDTLAFDLEEELLRKFRRKELKFVDLDRVSEVLDAQGGRFDPQLLSTKVPEADYAFVVRIENCSLREPSSPNLFRGRCRGAISGFALADEAGGRRAAQVFEQTFTLEYPKNHPVPSEQTPFGVFKRRFLSSLTEQIGGTFYNVNTDSLFAG